jgi:hypothetical protein
VKQLPLLRQASGLLASWMNWQIFSMMTSTLLGMYAEHLGLVTFANSSSTSGVRFLSRQRATCGSMFCLPIGYEATTAKHIRD